MQCEASLDKYAESFILQSVQVIFRVIMNEPMIRHLYQNTYYMEDTMCFDILNISISIIRSSLVDIRILMDFVSICVFQISISRCPQTGDGNDGRGYGYKFSGDNCGVIEVRSNKNGALGVCGVHGNDLVQDLLMFHVQNPLDN